MSKKVSILSPCYNVGLFISDFLNSIIDQNYDNLELILVNDGSTDNTEEVIKSYLEILYEKNIDVKYLYKENGGQASAIALGLIEVTGDYLIWPDSDDFLLPESIKKRVLYMENNPKCSVLRANGYNYNNDNKQIIGDNSWTKRKASLHDFVKFNIPWCPAGYMIRMSSFDVANPKRFIPNFRCGQNIQMLLPIMFYNSCEYLNDHVYGYRIRSDSHSHARKTYEEELKKLIELMQCVEKTLEIIPENTSEFINENRIFIYRTILHKAWLFSKKTDINKYYILLKNVRGCNFSANIKKRFVYSCFLAKVCQFYDTIERHIMRIL